MDTIKIRVTPLLKALGFRHTEGSTYRVTDDAGRLRFSARVSKTADRERVLEITKTVYDARGAFDHNEMVVKHLSLDPPANEETTLVYREILADLQQEMAEFANHTRIAERRDFLLGFTDETAWEPNS